MCYNLKYTLMNKSINSKVGNVSASTVNFNTWVSTPVIAQAAKPRQKEVINKIFLDYAKIIDDPFWVEKFNLASTGKFPANFYFYDNTLTYRKGAKNNKLLLPNNIVEAALEVIKFFQVNKSIFSPSDEEHASNSQTNFCKIDECLTWDIASKKIKECLISYFVMDMNKMMNLSHHQSIQLKQIINIGIFLKKFDKNNIILTNNRIFSIGGLYYDPEKKIFYIDPILEKSKNRTYSKKKQTNNLPKDTVPQFKLTWDKYINKYLEQINKQHLLLSIVSTIETEEEEEDYEED